MTLHVALEGIDGTGKTTLVRKLHEHFSNNERVTYKCRVAVQPICIEILDILSKYNLTNHEIALLMAFDRSFSYYGQDWSSYDLVFWDRSILSSYVYNTDENVNKLFIKQINKFFPEMDLYIIIESDKILDEQDYTKTSNLIQKYNEISKTYPNTVTTPYLKDKPEEMLKNVIELIKNNLPKCNWCPRLFKPSRKHRLYCSSECATASLEDQYRKNNREYFKRNKNTMSERSRGALGSKGANLHGKADPNPLLELEKVRNAKKAVGLKPII